MKDSVQSSKTLEDFCAICDGTWLPDITGIAAGAGVTAACI